VSTLREGGSAWDRTQRSFFLLGVHIVSTFILIVGSEAALVGISFSGNGNGRNSGIFMVGWYSDGFRFFMIWPFRTDRWTE
jgi:hypothetical protein